MQPGRSGMTEGGACRQTAFRTMRSSSGSGKRERERERGGKNKNLLETVFPGS